MRRHRSLDLRQTRKETGFVSERRDDCVIGMTRLPVGQNHNPRPHLAQNSHNLLAIFQRILDRAIRQIKRLALTYPQQSGRFGCFAARDLPRFRAYRLRPSSDQESLFAARAPPCATTFPRKSAPHRRGARRWQVHPHAGHRTLRLQAWLANRQYCWRPCARP